MENNEKVFCEMYAFGLDGPGSAVMAGYDPKEAAAIAEKLLASERIRAQIEQEKAVIGRDMTAIREDVCRMMDEFKTML